jgi:hypothetical protein
MAHRLFVSFPPRHDAGGGVGSRLGGHRSRHAKSVATSWSQGAWLAAMLALESRDEVLRKCLT